MNIIKEACVENYKEAILAEQLGANRIFRPSQIYTGAAPREWISLENRE